MASYRTYYQKPRRRGKKSAVSVAKKKKAPSVPKKKKTKTTLEMLKDKYNLHAIDLDANDEAYIRKLEKKRKKRPPLPRLYNSWVDGIQKEFHWGNAETNARDSNRLLRLYYADLLGITGAWDYSFDHETFDETMWEQYIDWVKTYRPATYEKEKTLHILAVRCRKMLIHLNNGTLPNENWNNNFVGDLDVWNQKRITIWQQIQDYYS